MGEMKAAARAQAYARRKEAFAARGPADAKFLACVLSDHKDRPLSGYMPMRTEIDPLLAMGGHAGPVGVPVIIGKGQALRFRCWTPKSAMVPGEFGALVPETGDWMEPAVLIVPLLAFDRRGYRLGYGGGFYDRTLEGLRARGTVLAIGFAFAAQEVAEVPRDGTDQRLDMIVTESGVIHPA
jgi:5-formyltetrahydrofolate cyclo-ligase